MKIGLWCDSHKGSRMFPNLASMKLSAYHKARGDSVELIESHIFHYDIAYFSKVFDFTEGPEEKGIVLADKKICGGTGYHLSKCLPDNIEHIYPDYSLFPSVKSTAYGFLTRGCPRCCKPCVVWRNEGKMSRQVADLSEFWHDEKTIKLLDGNLLACKDHERLLQQLADSKAWVDITHGFDIRLLTPDNMRLINSLRLRSIHFAWDNPTEDLTKKFQYFIQNTTMTKHRQPGVYVLTNCGSTIEQDLYRVYTLRDLGFSPYIMVFDKAHAPRKIRLLQRWVNNKTIFASVKKFEDYDPKHG